MVKGSMERSLLPWATFLIFTRNRPWKSEDHLCTLFFIEMSKGKTRKKRKNTASFVASLGAGVQPRSAVQLFMPVSSVEKRPFSQFFLGFGVSFGEGKPFVTSNASFKQETRVWAAKTNQTPSMTSECVRTDLILPRGAGLEHGRCKQSIFSLSIFDLLVEQLSF